HELLNVHASRAPALTQVVAAGGRGGDDMCLHFKTIPMHTIRIANAVLAVYGEPALDDMDDLTVMRNGNGTRLFERVQYIILLARIPAHSHGTSTVYARHMCARHPHQGRRDL